jgi:hypothetical protein
VDCEPLLLPEAVSVPWNATEAFAVAVPAEPAVAEIVIVALPLAGRVVSVHVTLEAAVLHEPWLDVAPVTVEPFTLMVTVVVGRSSGPLFETVAVY